MRAYIVPPRSANALYFQHWRIHGEGMPGMLSPSRFIFFHIHAAFRKNMVKIIGWRPAFLVSDLVWEILDPLLYSVLTVVYIVVVPVPRAVRSLRAVDRRSGGTYHHVHSLSSF